MNADKPTINAKAAQVPNSGVVGAGVLVDEAAGVGEVLAFGVAVGVDCLLLVFCVGGVVGVGVGLGLTAFTVTCVVAVVTVAPVASVICNWNL